MTEVRHCDVLIIGAGSAGSVMANRLSEQADCRVVLLDAGPFTAADCHKEAVQAGNQPAVKAGLNWRYPIRIKGDFDSAGPVFSYEAGKLFGGSSAINATQALRGLPEDYDEWRDSCGDSWSWSKVLPYFRKLENDPDGHSGLHGRDGPFPIRRESTQALTPLQKGLWQACTDHGFGETSDHNDPGRGGVGMIPKNLVEGNRISTKDCYLQPILSRPNLTCLGNAQVTQLLFSSPTRCSGALAMVEGQPLSVQARTVIVCAGAVATPALLQRSGIGDPQLLEKLNIEIRSPLVGVGEGLSDHPVVGLWGIPHATSCQIGEPLRQTLLRYDSGLSGYKNDMHICMMAGMNAQEMFPQLTTATLAGVTVCFNRSQSRGRVQIQSSDPSILPKATFNLLSVAEDIAPLKDGIKLAWQLLQSSSLKPHFQRLLAWTDAMIQSDKALESAVKTFVRPSAHVCSSARIGLQPDQGAVVSPSGQVYGIEQLYLADASVIPRIPTAPPHLTCLMVAEKLADELKAVLV